MNIDILDLITLEDDKRYVVSSKASYEGKIYYYLIAELDPENVKFCVEGDEDNSLDEVTDNDLLENVLFPLFIENSTPIITEILEENSDNNEGTNN